MLVSKARSAANVTLSNDGLCGLRVLIDGRKFGDGGIGRYIQNLLAGLIAHTKAEITVICSPDQESEFDNEYGKSISTLPVSVSKYGVRELFAACWQVPWNKYDLVHFPHFTVPFGIKIPKVVTIHDLIHLTHPEKIYYPLIGRFYIEGALKRANQVIAVSQATANQLKAYNRYSTSISVVPNSFIPSTLDDNLGLSVSDDTAGYFLAVLSNNKPHKKLNRLLEAYEILRTNHSLALRDLPDNGLIVVGPGSSIRSFAGGCSLGSLRGEQLGWYYAHARAIVVASDVEGFCLPILEARAYGVPAVTTPVPAIRELLCSEDVMAGNFSALALANALAARLERGNCNSSVLKQALSPYELPTVTRKIVNVYLAALMNSLQGVELFDPNYYEVEQEAV
jgi:glycosyltransferase involved in cell wall biosynthesis